MKKDIRKKKFINHPIEEVWEALSKEEKLSEWFMKANFKAEEGFKFEFTEPNGKKLTGEILTAQDPINLAYSWNDSNLNYTTYVWWKLATKRNGTLLELEHSGFKGISDYFGGFRYSSKWNKQLKKLTRYLTEASG